MGRVLIVSAGPDVAGCGIALKRAFDAVGGEWQARHVRRKDNWLHYPSDVEWRKGTDGSGVSALYEWADVIHVMDKPVNLVPHHKPVIVQHLGSRYRRDPEGISAACRAMGALEVTDGDLLLDQRMAYLPITVDIEGLSRLRQRTYRSGRIRIAHAPTNRELKSTETIIAAVNHLSKRHRIDFDLIERTPWAECLKRKARADIYIDELTLGYGANALECWAMGVPVVSGAEPRLYASLVQRFGDVPFVQADEESLERTVEALIVSAELRQVAAQRGRRFVERYHSHQVVVDLATAYYRHVMARQEAAA